MLRVRGLSLGAISEVAIASIRPLPTEPLRVFLCIADHFEPMWNGASLAVQRDRVERWLRDYPLAMERFEDSRGQCPQHTFFYPAERGEPYSKYGAEHVGRLAELCHAGWSDMEIHLHHHNDTSEQLTDTLEAFKQLLHVQHGLLQENDCGEITYGFVHGDWALDNSQPDGRRCGVNNELTILRKTGCYADFTMPAAPDPAQTRTVNSIYYAVDDPQRPKSHDLGRQARVGTTPEEKELLLIQGPMTFDWSRRRMGCLPRLENANLDGKLPPTLSRWRLWLRAGVGVAGRPDWIFVKLHTHGAPEHNASMLLGEPMRDFHADLRNWSDERAGRQYYYVTAREMADLVHQAERGAIAPSFDISGRKSVAACLSPNAPVGDSLTKEISSESR